ncbi:MAG TPA: hypothetical protein VFK86_13545 [Bauldia sp.]|nr:hypothetical protein [Bauldia sp.]
MRQAAGALIAGAVAVIVVGQARAQESGQPLAACAEAVGAYLSANHGKEAGNAFASRSLLSLSADGLVTFADSGQGGGEGFAPFTGGQGAWRCLASDAGSLRLSATILDFTLATPDWPNHRIGRLDIDATVEATKGTMNGTMTLLMAPFDGDPFTAAELVPDAAGPFDAVRIVAP